MQYLDLPNSDNPSIYCFDRFGKSYITETEFIYWDEITKSNDVEKVIMHRATEMRKRLMIMSRKAKIAYLKSEIELLNISD